MLKTLVGQMSLKTKLIGMTLSIVLVLGGVGILNLNHLIQQQEHEQADQFTSFAKALGSSLSAQFFERYSDVQAFAMNPILRSGDSKAMVGVLNDYAALYGIYDLIMVVDRDGKLVAVNDRSAGGKALNVKPLYEKNYASTEWFQAARDGKFTEDEKKGFRGTYFQDVAYDPLIESVYGNKVTSNSFTTVIKDASGRLQFVISNRANLDWIRASLRENYEELARMDLVHAETLLVSSSGLLLEEFHPKPDASTDKTGEGEVVLKLNLIQEGFEPAKKIAEGVSGYASYEESGVPMIAGYSRIDGAKFIDQIGWGIVIADMKSEGMASLYEARVLFISVFCGIIALAVALSFWFSGRISKQLGLIAERLRNGSLGVTKTSQALSKQSIELSEASTEQAAAIQQTAASVDEVTAMIRKNSENALESQRVSEESRENAQQGQQAVNQMKESIHEIGSEIERISHQVVDGNKKIAEIVKVISEIDAKTKVINDIVFQTKLLSFNASVEAARAGEHGKGFAVVAEEVGNLARMSGTAAKEITDLLSSSIVHVDTIIDQTKTQVERIVQGAQNRAVAGQETAALCAESLEKILKSVQRVDVMVGEISVASKEQSQGVSEINKAMNQLDQTTQQNASVAQSSADASKELLSQSDALKSIVDELNRLLSGQSSTEKNEAPVETHAAPASPQKVVKISSRLPKRSVPIEPVVPENSDPRFEDIA